MWFTTKDKRVTLNATVIKTNLLQCFKHDLYSYFTLQIMKTDVDDMPLNGFAR